MITKTVLAEIDRTIKEVWTQKVKHDYDEWYLLKEDSLKCSMYYHLRKKISPLLQTHNLRILPEFYFEAVKKRADLVIAELDFNQDGQRFSEYITDIIAVIELKFTDGTDKNTAEWVKDDIRKMKQYLQECHLDCQYYFACIYEEECSWLQWMDRRSINNWANGYVTELNAGFIDGSMAFEVHSYNGLNDDLND